MKAKHGWSNDENFICKEICFVKNGKRKVLFNDVYNFQCLMENTTALYNVHLLFLFTLDAFNNRVKHLDRPRRTNEINDKLLYYKVPSSGTELNKMSSLTSAANKTY